MFGLINWWRKLPVLVTSVAVHSGILQRYINCCICGLQVHTVNSSQAST